MKKLLYLLLLPLSLSAKIEIPEEPSPFHDPNLKVTMYGTGDYLQWEKYINFDDINLILEVGSRDAIDAIRLGYFYKAPVFAFECNPESIKLCHAHVKHYPYVTVVPYACWNENTQHSFYPVVQSNGGFAPVNTGASSLLVAKPNDCDAHHHQGKAINVETVRLDSWLESNQIETVDLLCMDCQGATLQVLQGLGERLRQVKYLISEIYIAPSFEGEHLYPEIKAYLESYGFQMVEAPPAGIPFCDLLFINKNL